MLFRPAIHVCRPAPFAELQSRFRRRAILFPRSQLDRGAGIQGFKIAKESGAYSVLLFLAEFLESGIAAQRIPNRIEPKKCRRNDNWINPHPAYIRGL